MTVLPPVTRGPHQISLPITDTERDHLDRLYRFDGAWTFGEALSAFSPERLRALIDHQYLGVTSTEMGDLLQLLARGRIATYRIAGSAVSLTRQINNAYFRLSLQALGWRFPKEGEPVRKLEALDPTSRFREVMTDYGLALVAGRLTSNGYSAQHIGRLSDRLRSTALSENFYVIILTPSDRKGQAHARQHPAYLKVISVLPHHPTPPEFQTSALVHPGQIIAAPTGPAPFLAGTAWRTNPEYLQLPPRVLSVLQMPRDERIEQAILSLECDGAMSAAQLFRFYGLRPEDLKDVHRVPALLRTTPSHFTSETPVEFLTLSARRAKQDVYRLGHRCGTGTMRHMLDVPPHPERYKAEHRGTVRSEEPDGVIFETDGRELALEYDVGEYTRKTIDKKLGAFSDRGFAGVIWGVSNVTRQRSLTHDIGDRLSQEILLAEWWK